MAEMQASVQFRPQDRDLGMVMREVDENLAIFLGIRNDAESKPKSLSPPGARPETTHQNAAADNFLNLEDHNTSDYDWLLKQREVSSLRSANVRAQDSTENQTENSNDELIFLKSELPPANNPPSAPPARRRPSSSGEQNPTSRAATPTGGRPLKSKPSHASTLTSSKPMSAQKRTSTPSRATSHTFTTPANSKPALRHVTPTRKPAAPSAKSSASSSDQSSLARKTGPTKLKNPVPSHGASSQAVKSPETLSSSHDATEIPKTSLPKRPASASRGRPCAPATRSSSASRKPRQKSCSPPKIRPSNFSVVRNGNIILLTKSRGYSNNDGDYRVNPVVMGTKMVERVVNMRKLAPPKQDDCVSINGVKKSSLENSGFGRSLSKKSLDMAIRHMDIRRSIPGDIRPTAAVLSPSACGIQSSSSKGSRVGISGSPLTSSSDSSKSSNGVDSCV